MKYLISGASGLVGSALTHDLSCDGHTSVRLVRRASEGEHELSWDPSAGKIDQAGLAGFDAVVHLAGENVAGRRWSAEQKKRIRDSRVLGTSLLAQALAHTSNRPKVVVCASAVGYYGSRGDQVINEASEAGVGFLPDTCIDWEAAARPIEEAGIRLVHLRIGVVLSRKGGALQRMLMPFRLGFGGRLGTGQQFMSWIALKDLVRMIRFSIHNENIRGVYNATAPAPATNADFTKTLGKVLNRPTFLPVPSFALQLLFGRKFADDLLLTGVRAVPQRMQDAGFEFHHPDLEGALRAALQE